MLSTVYLAAEDEPGLAVGRKLVEEAPPLSVYREDNAHGAGRLRNKAKNYQQMGSRGAPVLMITDLDLRTCPSGMIADWLGEPPSEGFLFRICVREIEAWLLAHRSALAAFLRIPLARVPLAPESLRDPKAALIALAKNSTVRRMREGFLPVGTATIGPEYNQLLGVYIREFWDAQEASVVCPSLKRAREKLQFLASMVA